MKRKTKKAGQNKTSEKRGEYWNNRGNTALRDKMKKIGLSLQDVAKAIQRKRHAVWKWVHGLSRPVVEVRVRIREEFGIPQDWWLSPAEKASKKAALKELDQSIGNGKPTKAQLRTRKILCDTLGIKEESKNQC